MLDRGHLSQAEWLWTGSGVAWCRPEWPQFLCLILFLVRLDFSWIALLSKAHSHICNRKCQRARLSYTMLPSLNCSRTRRKQPKPRNTITTQRAETQLVDPTNPMKQDGNAVMVPVCITTSTNTYDMFRHLLIDDSFAAYVNKHHTPGITRIHTQTTRHEIMKSKAPHTYNK